MPGNFKKEDLRIKRTFKALRGSMLFMLSRKNFTQITVNDLCEEALISRATFYVHFNDKYDLLKYLLSDVSESVEKTGCEYEGIDVMVNQFVQKNQKLITNILMDANDETSELIHDFISSIISIFLIRKGHNPTDPNYSSLSDFCTGGIITLSKKHLSSNTDLMNSYIYSMLKHIIEWNNEQDNKQI